MKFFFLNLVLDKVNKKFEIANIIFKILKNILKNIKVLIKLLKIRNLYLKKVK